MSNKAQWHTDLNSGTIPICEFPDGTMLYETRVLLELANDIGKDKGLELYSKDPLVAA